MSIYAQFETDPKKENEGVWLDIGLNDDGTAARFLLKRAGKNNKAWNAAFERESRPYRRQLETGTIDPKVSERITMQAFVGSVLVGWENIQGRDGKPLGDFDKQKALGFLADLPELWDWVWEQARGARLFRPDAPSEAEVKNS